MIYKVLNTKRTKLRLLCKTMKHKQYREYQFSSLATRCDNRLNLALEAAETIRKYSIRLFCRQKNS